MDFLGIPDMNLIVFPFFKLFYIAYLTMHKNLYVDTKDPLDYPTLKIFQIILYLRNQ